MGTYNVGYTYYYGRHVFTNAQCRQQPHSVVADAHGNVEEVNHYYPYGALMGDSRNTTTQPYKYIGIELDHTHGLDWYDHGVRHYDPVTGRWNVMDALAEKYYAWSHDERESDADGLFSKKMGGLPVLVIEKDEVTRGFYHDFNDGESFGFGDGLRLQQLNILSSWLNQHRRAFLQVK